MGMSLNTSSLCFGGRRVPGMLKWFINAKEILIPCFILIHAGTQTPRSVCGVGNVSLCQERCSCCHPCLLSGVWDGCTLSCCPGMLVSLSNTILKGLSVALNIHIKLFELSIFVLLDLKVSDKWEEMQDGIYWASSKRNHIFLQEKKIIIFKRWTCHLVTMEYHVYNRKKIVVYCMYWSKTLHNSFGLVWTAFVVGVFMLSML